MGFILIAFLLEMLNAFKNRPVAGVDAGPWVTETEQNIVEEYYLRNTL